MLGIVRRNVGGAGDLSSQGFGRLRPVASAIRNYSSGGKEMTVRDALNSALDEEMAADPNVFVMGEEVGEYQGAYKVRISCLSSFPQKN